MRITLITLAAILAFNQAVATLQGRPFDYAYNVLVTIDLAVNSIILGGDPEETISSRLGKWLTADNSESERDVWVRKQIARAMCETGWLDLLNLERDHCVKSINPREGSEGIRP